jgi:protein-L-isoaspartate(D-aspartate) O-methyltransferase
MSFRLQRERLVECKLRKLGIRDEAVLQAMLEVPREQFVPEKLREFAYRNLPQPINPGQTISQPVMVAEMMESLRIGCRSFRSLNWRS